MTGNPLSPPAAPTPCPAGGEDLFALPSGRTTGAGEEAGPLAFSPANLSAHSCPEQGPGAEEGLTPDLIRGKARLEGPSNIIREVLAMRAEQAARFGHTPESDARQPLYRFGVLIAQRGADIREDAQFNRTENMRLRLVKLTALALAAIERIDSEAILPGTGRGTIADGGGGPPHRPVAQPNLRALGLDDPEGRN